jgi:hypothetical protein
MIDCASRNNELLALDVVLFTFEVLLGHDFVLINFSLFKLVAQRQLAIDRKY